ncbi:hypothetical protein [Lacipirellula parvula]|uniref:Glycosyl hydrolase family 32 N-terminal domain-containing protein n=1 Tax=Lacipirellula parvula TaxID=2650471 RepID=A0A5K7XAA8_9BACT|nr:hypothetical protein [Lacipirellula parvula]BBO32842.1 hypothetical protein PLANPX_2454 [Lacipirellula parvula]
MKKMLTQNQMANQTRRRQRGLSWLIAIALCWASWAESSSAEGPIDIGSRRELFVDDFLIDDMRGTTLQLQRPVDRGQAFAFDKPWEGEFSGYVTVIKSGDKYQAYYRGSAGSGSKNTGDHQVLCYAESPDGIVWSKPEFELFAQGDDKSTNVVLANVSPDTHNFSPFVDARPGVPAAEKYKGVGGYHQTGLRAYASPDGVHWKALSAKPVLTRQEVGFIEGSEDLVFDSQNVPFWSEKENKYLLFYRVYVDGIRRTARVESDDFIHWSKPTLMEYRRLGESAPIEQLYTNQTHPYFRAPHIFVGTAARFMLGRQVLNAEQAKAIKVDPKYFHDTSDAVLITSRGGNVYDRTFMEALVAPGIGAENWTSRTNYPALNVVQTGPHEMSLYVNQNYGQPTAHLRRYSLRLDGFAAVHADYVGGEMTTKPLIFAGDELLLNFATSAAGGILVEIQGESGKPIPGFASADCLELVGNEIARPVVWKDGKLGALAGQPVRLRFVMKDADLFAIQFDDGAAAVAESN